MNSGLSPSDFKNPQNDSYRVDSNFQKFAGFQDSTVTTKTKNTLEVATQLNEILNSPNGNKYFGQLVSQTECKLQIPKHRSTKSHMNLKTKVNVDDHLSEIDSVKSDIESSQNSEY